MDRLLLQEKHIYTIPNFLTEDEIAAYKTLVLNPPDDATDFTNSGKFQNKKWVDPAIADAFYERLKQYIEPSPLALRANNLVMTGHYEAGEQFGLHTDTGLFYSRSASERSCWTLLIYLNDDYEGGHTLFYDDDWKPTESIKPEKGKALLFDIDLWHRGDIITIGEKYWIGCEIIGKMTASHQAS